MLVNEIITKTISEGPNDPAIFKAIFTAGGPGSGKSFVVKNSGFEGMGFKIVNSDTAFEQMLAKMGMSPDPETIYSPQGQDVRDKAKNITRKRQEIYTDTGRLGLVMDGTGKDYEKIVRMSEKLRQLGYETAMVFVNTDLETAQQRNKLRARTLPEDVVSKMWSQVQNNIGKFQRYFREDMFIIDNSESSDVQSDLTSAFKQISAWSKTIPNNRIAQQWMAGQAKSDK
jgi:predicted kinase